MNACGINRGTAGNVSARCGDGFIVTPTGMDYAKSLAVDMVFMRIDGTTDGVRKPSSEWRFHRDIYAARPEIGAVVHTHSLFATSLACLGMEIPPFHYMIARFGGEEMEKVLALFRSYGQQ
ncbi:MAG: class II aldolase/adducin family protein [Rhodocyclaceae bacterium]|nr:class II aldolase/adducin family protein [Rhodocyclaceae bacterium]